MGKKKKHISHLRKEEEAVVASLSCILHTLFQTRYREYKGNNYKSKDTCGEKKNNSSANKNKKASSPAMKHLKSELEMLIAFYGIGTPHITPPDQTPLSREQTMIIDIDFEGLRFIPSQDDLSSPYRLAKESTEKYPLQSLYQPSEYDLNQVPSWQEMKKFNSFHFMHHQICNQLAKINYPLEQLNQLTFFDMLDMINIHNRECPAHKMPNQRTRFLKMFSACYGQEFSEKMALLGKEKQAKDFLTYINYLDKPTKRCPPEVRYVSEIFSVHHIKNRQYANEFDDYSQANDISNLSLCFNFPHHKVLHTPTEIDLNRNIIFFGGFLREFQIIRNPEKERLYFRGKLKTPSLSKDGR